MTEKAAQSAAFLWQSPRDRASCFEYWQAGAGPIGQHQSNCIPQGQVRRMVLSDLQAETRYAYQVSTIEPRDASSEGHRKVMARTLDKMYEFTTGSAREETLQFVVMGDSHGNQEVIQGLLTRILQDRPNLDFLLHVGDAVNNGSVAGSWTSDFLGPAHAFLATVPVHLVMGNHEHGASPPFLLSPAPNPELPMVSSFVKGQAFFLLANSNLDLSPGSEQIQDLERRLSSPEALGATWRFVAFHHPPFAAGWRPCDGFDGDRETRQFLVPLLTRHGVDMVFNGHVHGYERGQWQGVTYVTTGGGGGALDHACTRWPHIVVSRYVHHALDVDISGKHLSVTARALDGAIIDHFELNK